MNSLYLWVFACLLFGVGQIMREMKVYGYTILYGCATACILGAVFIMISMWVGG